MRKAALALLLATILLAPSARAGYAPLPYPDELVKLLPGWVADAQKAGANDANRTWWAEANGFLEKAKLAAQQGRVRSAIFDIETYDELRTTGELIDKATASLTTVGEQKAYVLNEERVARAAANQSWLDFRRSLHNEDNQVRSVRTAELAVYAADIALISKFESLSFDAVADDFLSKPGLDRGDVLGLVHGAQTLDLEVSFASDVLGAAGEREGVPPAILPDNWTALARAVTYPNQSTTSSTKPLEDLAVDSRVGGEVILSIAFTLAEQRATRAGSIQQIYGDAKGRVGTVQSDLARNMGKQLANASLALAQSYGLLGVFTSDAVDRGVLAEDLVEQGFGDESSIIASWASLDGATYVVAVLGALSPVHPAPTPSPPAPRTPDLALPIACLAVVGVALLARKKR